MWEIRPGIPSLTTLCVWYVMVNLINAKRTPIPVVVALISLFWKASRPLARSREVWEIPKFEIRARHLGMEHSGEIYVHCLREVTRWEKKPRDLRKAVETSFNIKDVIYHLLLEDNGEHDTAKYLIDIELMSWKAFSEVWDFAKPVFYQPSIEWKSLENNASHSYHDFPLWMLRC